MNSIDQESPQNQDPLSATWDHLSERGKQLTMETAASEAAGDTPRVDELVIKKNRLIYLMKDFVDVRY